MKMNSTLRILVLSIWIFVLISSDAVAQTSRRVTGKVSDETGAPVIAASVVVKGTSAGTSTDTAGNYSISVTGTPTLVFSGIGFSQQEMKVDAGSNTLNVQMKANQGTASGADVVVIGYGTQRKADLTGSVASVSSREFGAKPFTSPDQILAGRVSGVSISNRSGDPAAPVEVRIRGVGTVGNNQPLFVIDGVPITNSSNVIVNTGSAQETNPLAGINPSDIESMDVLKDASATAIYGARAANGVVIITTKKGKEGRMNLTYDGYTGRLNVPGGRIFKVLDVPGYVALEKELGNDFSAFATKPNVDWQRVIFKSAIATNHNITASGGSQNATYSISGGYFNQGGIERAQGFRRYSMRISSDLKATKWLKVGETILLSAINRDLQGEDAQFAAYSSSRNAPFFQPYTSAGQYNPRNDMTAPNAATAVNYAWLTDPNFETTNVQNKKMLGNVYVELTPIKHFNYRASFGIDANLIDGLFHLYPVDLSVVGGKGSNLFKSEIINQERAVESTITLANTLTYNNQWGDHKLTVLAGYEQSDYRFDKMRIQGTNPLFAGLPVASLSQSVSATQPKDLWGIRGILGRVFYSYKDRYLFTANLRNDESSRFATEQRSKLFPSGSIGWRISEESFMKNIKWLNDLKVRASYGNTGNQFTGVNFAYLSTLGTNIGYVIGTGQRSVSAVAPLTLNNIKLHWETTTQLDFGLDFTMMNYKLSGTVDFFDKTTNGLLLAQPIAATTGYYAALDVNSGQMKNTGVEIAASYKDKIGKLSFSVGANATFVNNRITRLPVAVVTNTENTKQLAPGYSIGYFYGYRMTGIYQTDAEAITTTGNANAKAGDVKFEDVNGDKKITDADRTIIGRAVPGYYYGLNLSANYKEFDLSLIGQGVGNVQIFNTTRQTLESMSGGDNQSVSVLNRWTSANHSTTMPRAVAGDPNGNNVFSTRWLENGSYFRIKNIQVGYTFTPAFLKSGTNNVVTSARLFVGVLNPFLFTKYKGYDPEVTRPPSFTPGESQLNNGIDAGGAPQPFMIQGGWLIRF